ncbi:MAG: terpene cyclase/mutase family protein [Planctomycetia bacterium]|nr:terpene cyclase/mutase family protein [Planctomycetia bacterium]
MRRPLVHLSIVLRFLVHVSFAAMISSSVGALRADEGPADSREVVIDTPRARVGATVMAPHAHSKLPWVVIAGGTLSQDRDGRLFEERAPKRDALARLAKFTTGAVEFEVVEGNAADDKGGDDKAAADAREKIKQSLSQAAAFIASEQKEDGSWKGPIGIDDGASALCALALVRAGRAADDAAVAKALRHLEGLKPTYTYTVALQTIVFCEVDRAKYAEPIRRNVKWLVDLQTADGEARGGWSYGPKRDERSDGSNTHYAVWALDAARRAGIEVTRETWQLVARYWLSSQKEDGSWGYQVASSPGTPTMTLAGIHALAAVRAAEEDEELRGKIDTAIERAWKWHDKGFSVTEHWKRRNFRFYCLESLSAAAQATKHDRIGDADWRPQLAGLLLAGQEKNGSWTSDAVESPLVATSFAIIILSGAASP